MFVDRSGQNEQFFIKDIPLILPTMPNGFRGEDFFKSTNQKKELPVAAMFANESGRNKQSL